jgi:glyoxylase-like metal-dependent hydrolase (beta-lactamase superfamily II)
MSEHDLQRWKIGDATITSVVEDEVAHIPPELFFPDATAAVVRRHEWLVPDYADADGNVTLRVQALVVEHGGRTVLVDPCVGNGKVRSLPFWNNGAWPFLERFAAAGFAPAAIDTVVHTHLHVDHVGWDTHLEDGAWVPTFTSARHLYTQRELDWVRAHSAIDHPVYRDDVVGDSIQPVIDAGLSDIVAEDADLGAGLRLESTPGHTPGHVSLWLESAGEHALITGDFLHHPVQCAETQWAEIADDDVELARETRRRMLSAACSREALTIGTHFPTRPAGRVVRDGDAFRFVAVA